METSVIERTGEAEVDDGTISSLGAVAASGEAIVIYPVCYAGDEQPFIHRRHPEIDGGFWTNKPA